MATPGRQSRKSAQDARIAAGKRQRASGAIVSGGVRELTDDELADVQIGDVLGTSLDWRDELFLDPLTGVQWDGGDIYARDMVEMLKRYHRAKAVEMALTQPIKQATWKLVPGDGDTGEAADTEEKLRRPYHAGGQRTPIQLVIAQATSATWARRAFFGKAFKLDTVKGDGSVLYTDISMRPASTCRLIRDPRTGILLGFQQDLNLYTAFDSTQKDKWAGKPVDFKRSESVVFIHGSDRDPVSGVSDLDVAYWCYRTRQKMVALWLSYLAGQALPRTSVKHSGDEAKAVQAAQAIAAVGSSGVFYFDGNNLEIDVLDVSGKGDASFVAAIQYMDECVYESTLTGFLGLTSAATHGRGSNALALSAQDFFMDGREAFATEMETTFTSDIVSPMVRHNHGANAVFPTFKFDPLGGIDDSKVFALLEALATAAQTTLPQEFIDELTIMAARVLDMDIDKIKESLTQAAAAKVAAAKAAAAAGQAAPPPAAAAMGGAVDQARKLIESHPLVQQARVNATNALKASGATVRPTKAPAPAGV